MTKNLLLVAAAALAVTPLSAQKFVDYKSETTPFFQTVKANKHSLKSSRIAPVIKSSSLLNPVFNAPAQAPASGQLLNESFEGWDGTTANWLPSGWQNLAKGTVSSPWFTDAVANDGFKGVIGKYAAYLQWVEDDIDEWLVTPEVKNIEAGMKLSFLHNVSAYFMYSLDNFDADKMDWVGAKKVQYTVRVLAKADNERNWKTLLDIAELPEYKNMTGAQAVAMLGDQMQRFSIDLDDYAGKNVQFAFEYAGADGESAVIDNVIVGFPALEAAYVYPKSTMFYGISRDFEAIDYSVAMLHAYSPITWSATTEQLPNNQFTWSYMGPDNEDGTYTGPDLTLTYHTDYTNAFTTRNNWYTSPKLTVSAPGSSATSVTNFEYFQAGGIPEYEATESTTGAKKLLKLGVTTFDHNTEGLSLYTEEGDTPVPIFGYSSATDLYWTRTILDKGVSASDNAYVDAIVNYCYTTDDPIIIKGGWIHGMGYNVNPNAEIQLDIIPLDKEGNCRDASGKLYTPIASAVCAGDEVVVDKGEGMYDYLMIPFEFLTPAVVSKEDCDAFIVRVSGIHECADFFIPFQSEYDNYAGLALGWIDIAVTSDGETTYRLDRVADYTGNLQSFAIMLDATYPWLHSEGIVEIPESGSANLDLDSYHYISDLMIDGAPSWLTAAVTGTRYGDAKLLLKAKTDTPQEATITLSAKGVKHQIKIKAAATSSVAGINADAEREVKAIYTSAGKRVADMEAPGIYIVTYTNGTVEKIVRM